MKLHLDNPASRNLVTGYGAGYVAINHRQYASSLILLPDRIIESWAGGGYDALVEDDFAAIRALGPEILLLGTGNRQRFPAPHLLRPLIEARIGCEVMDLPAACRTFNILMAEGRLVAAALLIEAMPS
ncbi:MAG: Mth938-like domain-containing protein [Rhodocyclales bacterium]|nr:Mth938-like domain-containing protein [Rhodocyclales bacterium]